MHRIIFLVLVLCYGSSSAQVEWVEYPGHPLDPIGFIHKTSDQKFIGWSNGNQSLYISNGLGEEWEHFAQLIDYTSIFAPVIYEDREGRIHLFYNQTFYRLHIESKSVTPISRTDGSFNPVGFLFSTDGSTIAYDSYRIAHFKGGNASYVQINDQDWFSSPLVQGKNDDFYITTRNRLLIFDSHLNEQIGDFITPFIIDELLFDSLGRLYTEEGYTDDFVKWHKYPNNIRGKPIITNDGKLHLLDRKVVYTSSNRGNDFSECLVDLEGHPNRAFPYNEEGLIYYNDLGFGGAYHSHNSCTDWLIIDGYSDTYSSGLLEAVSKDEIFLLKSFPYDSYLWNSSMWLDNGEQDCIRSSAFLESNRSGIYFMGDQCKSTDKGKSWSMMDINNTENIVQNNSGIYTVDRETIFKSVDEGYSWTKTEADLDSWLQKFTVSIGEKVYYYSRFNDKMVYILNSNGLLEDSISVLNQPLKFVNLQAAYDNEKVFFVELNNFWNSVITVYNENTNSKTSHLLPFDLAGDELEFKIDHLNNLYFYNDEIIWMSIDEGVSWLDITPTNSGLIRIIDLDVSWDNYLFVSTIGTPVLRSMEPLVVVVTTQKVEDPDILVYPNPAEHILNIDIPAYLKVYSVSVFDMNGTQVYSQSEMQHENQINIENLNEGLHLLEVLLKSGHSYRKKVAVVH